MDVVQSLALKEHQASVHEFVVAGHSKRGHTTWLAAAADKRISGIIPIAIDILNSKAQLPHQLEAFGEYSTPSKAATDFLQELEQPRGQSLIKMVDAYSFREHLTIPKLIVSATNDDFFTTDALNLYWDGLKKPKWVLYLSNANHVGADSDPRINPTAFAFVRAVAAHKSLPEFNWQYIRNENKIVLKITADATATKARLWTSQSENKDFRQAFWTSQPMPLKGKAGNFNEASESIKEYSMEVSLPSKGYVAIFGEVEFRQNGRTFLLSTQTNISSLKE
jgi:PhoPQ-activated pathogenicity-related protein